MCVCVCVCVCVHIQMQCWVSNSVHHHGSQLRSEPVYITMVTSSGASLHGFNSVLLGSVVSTQMTFLGIRNSRFNYTRVKSPPPKPLHKNGSSFSCQNYCSLTVICRRELKENSLYMYVAYTRPHSTSVHVPHVGDAVMLHFSTH